MSRTRRSHLPGAVFHLTARTQGAEGWFTERLRSRIVAYTGSAVRTSDARLLAYSVMPNHLHLVVQQGRWPLGHVMQPLLRRIALLVQRSRGAIGHVFERRFRDQPCLDPEHVRNAIVYTHLNPVRAGLVAGPGDYAWSSHALYAESMLSRQPPELLGLVAVGIGLELFGEREGMTRTQLREAYRAHVEWRMQRDRDLADDADSAGVTLPSPTASPQLRRRLWPGPRPLVLRSGVTGQDDDASGPRFRADLADTARSIVAQLEPRLSVDRVRSGEKSRRVVQVRRAVVRRLSAAGHSGRAIAVYLRVSDQCVSNILARARTAPGPMR